MSDNGPNDNDRAHQVWQGLAEYWDAQVGADGNSFHRTLVGPNVERLLEVAAGDRILDIACGTGTFLRRLVALGADVVGADFSANMLAQARRRAEEADSEVDLRVVDATDEAQLLALGEGAFDSIVCNNALMDMAEIEPLMRAVPRLLRPGGRFVFSISHPVFNSGSFEWSFEAEDRDGEYIERRAVKIWDYLEPSAKPGLAMIDQPVEGYYMHRPLSLLLKAAFDAGLVVDALEEPAYPPSDELQGSRPHSWQNFPLIPPTLIVRLRPAAAR
ncbi:MAG TPA: class I SAM-dependent methyltransferase [Dehalococcoidia bacterium]|nr:class I SAM-dependent methyltransferase [Dehalococcoidia bacterium]